MKAALVAALVLVATGVAAAPGAEACADSCKVGPCTIHMDYRYAVWNPVTDRMEYYFAPSSDCI